MSYILLVDDDPIFSLALEACLQGDKVDVIPALNFEEAIGAINSIAPKLVLLDMNMPEVSGLELLAKLMKNPEKKNIPVVAMSTPTNNSKLEAAVSLGAHSYIHKPIDTEKLQTLITTLIGKNDVSALKA